jgi:hypothetical protein
MIAKRRSDRWNFLPSRMRFRDLFNYDFRRTEMHHPVCHAAGRISFAPQHASAGATSSKDAHD